MTAINRTVAALAASADARVAWHMSKGEARNARAEKWRMRVAAYRQVQRLNLVALPERASALANAAYYRAAAWGSLAKMNAADAAAFRSASLHVSMARKTA